MRRFGLCLAVGFAASVIAAPARASDVDTTDWSATPVRDAAGPVALTEPQPADIQLPEAAGETDPAAGPTSELVGAPLTGSGWTAAYRIEQAFDRPPMPGGTASAPDRARPVPIAERDRSLLVILGIGVLLVALALIALLRQRGVR